MCFDSHQNYTFEVIIVIALVSVGYTTADLFGP